MPEIFSPKNGQKWAIIFWELVFWERGAPFENDQINFLKLLIINELYIIIKMFRNLSLKQHPGYNEPRL